VRLTAYLAGAAGLFIIYRGLRRDFVPGVALLSALLCIAGTSLLSAVVTADWADVLAFAIVSALVFESARARSNRVTYAAWGIAALVPLVARYVSGSELQSLFGADGFFSLTPATYVALVGTIAYVRRSPFWTAASLSLVVLWSGAGANLLALIGPLAPGLALRIAALATLCGVLAAVAPARRAAALDPAQAIRM